STGGSGRRPHRPVRAQQGLRALRRGNQSAFLCESRAEDGSHVARTFVCPRTEAATALSSGPPDGCCYADIHKWYAGLSVGPAYADVRHTADRDGARNDRGRFEPSRSAGVPLVLWWSD